MHACEEELFNVEMTCSEEKIVMSKRGIEREVMSLCVKRMFTCIKFIGKPFKLKRVTRAHL